MLHHVSVGSNDLGRARTFYEAVMPILGMRLMEASEQGLDFGSGVLMFSVERPVDGQPATAGNGVHIAFAAEDRKMVDQFHAAALAHGGQDAGAPGVRPNYDAHYYGAFVRDPDGNKLGGRRSEVRRGRSPKPRGRAAVASSQNEACTGDRAQRGREAASSGRRQAPNLPLGLPAGVAPEGAAKAAGPSGTAGRSPDAEGAQARRKAGLHRSAHAHA